jgi:ABC-type phosphate transport system auxiliary subunit
LQASHNKFRNQIAALEGVKELTITLQSNCNVLYQENLTLTSENKGLERQLEDLRSELKARQEADEIQAKALHDSELELAMFRGRFEQLSKSHMEVGPLLFNY